MQPSSYAAEYIEYLNRQGKYPYVSGSIAPEIEPEVQETPKAVPTRTAKRREERKIREMETRKVPTVRKKVITQTVLARSSVILVTIGVLLIMSVWMSAKATMIQYNINSLTKSNVQLQDEISNLEVQIESAVSFETVEQYAAKNANMDFASQSQCVYLDEEATVDENLAKTIREKAYGN